MLKMRIVFRMKKPIVGWWGSLLHVISVSKENFHIFLKLMGSGSRPVVGWGSGWLADQMESLRRRPNFFFNFFKAIFQFFSTFLMRRWVVSRSNGKFKAAPPNFTTLPQLVWNSRLNLFSQINHSYSGLRHQLFEIFTFLSFYFPAIYETWCSICFHN